MYLAASFAHWLFPQKSNNHKAKALHPSVLMGISVFFLVFQFVFRYANTTYPSVLGYAANISTTDVITLTNEKRQAAGLSPVTFNQNLANAAKEKGEHMLANGYWAHVAPDGTDPWYFFTKNAYKYRYAGENLARDFSSASSAVDAWMASPSHRDNLLSSKYKEVGIAVVEGNLSGSDATIIVQLFGTQLSDSGQSVPIAKANTLTTVPTKTPATLSLTITPTPLPSPTEVPVAIAQTDSSTLVNSPQVTDENVQVSSLFSPFQTTRGISIAVLSILIFVTVLDAAIIAWRKTPRVSGRAFAHVAFLGMIIVVVLIVRAGKIL
jgi:uncharacterized protein YkwD